MTGADSSELQCSSLSIASSLASSKRLRETSDQDCNAGPKRTCSPPPASMQTSCSLRIDTQVEELELPWGSHASSGSRAYMEDTYAAGKAVVAEANLFAVFDGHGGSSVAEFLAANAQSYISRALSDRLSSSAGTSTRSCSTAADGDAWVEAAMAEALRDAFLALDRDLPARATNALGGSTAVCVLLDDQRLVCANCGERSPLHMQSIAIA